LRLIFPEQTSSLDDPLPEFAAPPVIETSIGIQFDGLDGYASLHAASYWERIQSEYPRLEEHPPLEPAFETFGPADGQIGQAQIQLIQGAIRPRYFFINGNDDKLVQLQGDRLFLNWRKRSEGAEYPRHAHIRAEFEKRLKELLEWAGEKGLGQINPTQCEALYVNRIPLRDAAGANCGLSYFFPWLQNLIGTTESGSFNFNRRLTSEEGRPLARLHMNLHYGTDPEGKREARLMLHVRGSPLESSFNGCLAMIDAEREIIVRTFAELTSPQAHAIWERTL
jgi:uncharacterized protein (TIGR04255 family)